MTLTRIKYSDSFREKGCSKIEIVINYWNPIAFADTSNEYLTIDINQFQAFMFDINFPWSIFSK